MSAEAKPVVVRKRSTSKTKKKKVVKASETGSTSTSASASEKASEPRPPTRTVAEPRPPTRTVASTEKASEPRPPTRAIATTESRKEARQSTAHAQRVVKAESPPDDRESKKEHANGHLEESPDGRKASPATKAGRFDGKVVIITGKACAQLQVKVGNRTPVPYAVPSDAHVAVQPYRLTAISVRNGYALHNISPRPRDRFLP